MNRASSLCRDAGACELVWAVHEKNAPALNFYRRLGAEEIRDLRFLRLQSRVDRRATRHGGRAVVGASGRGKAPRA